MKESGPTQLYRCYAADGALLYVGVSYSAVVRVASHLQTGWAGDVGNIKVESFPTREAALAAGLAAIRHERPRFNLAGVPKSPKSSKPPKPSNISVTIGVRLRNELHAASVRITQRERRSVSWVMAEAAADYVKRDVQATKRRKAP